MATTTNPVLTTAWQEIVDDETAAFWLSLPHDCRKVVEVLAWADTGADDAGTGAITTAGIHGHELIGARDRRESVNRDVIGDGYVYARVIDNTGLGETVLARLTK